MLTPSRAFRYAGSGMDQTGTKRVLAFVETVTAEAEAYAKAKGCYESLLRTKELVRQTIPSLREVRVDLEPDPDEGGYPTICFLIRTAETVDTLFQSDIALEEAFAQNVPARDRIHLSFQYQFE